MYAGASAVRSSEVSFDLDLDVFDGPFDLLVTLILRDEIDIWEVRVSRIIAEYVLKLADSGEFDIDATSQFVVLVAALLEMKSRLLLEEPSEDDLEDIDPDDAAEQLIERLVRYGQFKNAGVALCWRWGEHAGRLYRTAPVPQVLRRQPPVAGAVPPEALVAALAPLLREPPRPDTGHLADLAVSLIHELRRLRVILGGEGRFTFAAIAPQDRIERAVTFFALLELHSSGEAVLRQTRHLGDIHVTRSAGRGALLAAASPATG